MYAIEGNAGFISWYAPQQIWLTDVAGLFRVKDCYLEKFGKQVLSLFLQNFFISNRHNTGTQPKFLIKNILNKEIDLNLLNKFDYSTVEKEVKKQKELNQQIFLTYSQKSNDVDFILISDLIDSYVERGSRLVIGRDLYNNSGDVKVISSTTTGPMGFYNRGNQILSRNDIVYSIDGANAGFVSIYPQQEIFLTDHAGIITIKEKYVNTYGIVNLANLLQMYFIRNRTSNGTQPTFMLKNILNLPINIGLLNDLENLDFTLELV